MVDGARPVVPKVTNVPPRETSTTRVLLRLVGWTRGALRPMVFGGVSALGASVVSLVVPQVLRRLVNGPLLTAGTRASVLEAGAAVLGLGVIEAFLVW